MPATAAGLAFLAERSIPEVAGLADLVRLAIAVQQAVPPVVGAACSKGCSACCHQSVPLSPAEAFHVADLMRRDPALRQSAARTRRRARMAGDGHAAWVVGRIACPALDREGACSIHQQRPLVCRDHLVASDPAGCWDPRGTAIDLLPVSPLLGPALVAASAALLACAPMLVPLHHALDWARRHRRWACRRWRRDELCAALAGAITRR